MPRQSRSRPAPRPAAPAPQQSRGAHTAAAPPTQYGQHPPQPPVPAQPQGPGMLGQMAATAGSVAIGSTLGHGLSSMLFGGGSREAAPAPEAPAPPAQSQFGQQGMTCDFQAKEFTKCLETADVASCGWYLEQLKACQAAARPY
ncbi:hypothetical protein FRB94_002425 [Tulasnella sp. JGI-2019a]|nr:hypothetical protein FRB94_002425 [Tulasnella sp. JGI-2019a]